MPAVAPAADARPFDALQADYVEHIRPLLKQFCLDCHSAAERKGELDLERFGTLADVRRDPPAWQQVAEMLDNGEMPPADSPQPAAVHRKRLRSWIQAYLDAEALANAGDPGPVVLRRLNNAEYTYTIQDLTGVALEPAHEFPADSAAGEGFTNTGASLVMSPALVQKYIAAAKQVADHAVLLPDGFRFSAGTTRRDWESEMLGEIRRIYARHTSGDNDLSILDRWSTDPEKSFENDGRVDLEPYFSALLRHRGRLAGDLDAAAEIARQEGLNAKYLRLLATVLVSEERPSLLLAALREQFRAASPEDAAALAAAVRAWQDRLWKFNRVGHLGPVRPWQEPVSPIEAARHFQVQLEPPEGGDTLRLFLWAGSAGDGNTADVVAWQNARLQRPGRPPIMLRDVRAVALRLSQLRQQTLNRTSQYLAAAWQARQGQGAPDVDRLAAAHDVDPLVLKPLLAYLGIEAPGAAVVRGYLTQCHERPDYSFVKAWVLPGVADYSLVGNGSDQTVNIPGTLKAHRIAVHPRPERWIAAGWRSPLNGRVQLTPFVQDAHPACGNGVTWRLELRRGSQLRVLAAGQVDRAGTAAAQPLRDFAVRQDDLISLVIGPRDRNHACDLTEIDLTIVEAADEPRRWSLAGDCADSLAAGNPHPDRLGNPGVWHFYGGLLDGESAPRTIPAGSLLAQWLDAGDEQTARRLAERFAQLVRQPLGEQASPADADVYRQWTSLDGPLFSHVDSARLAETVSADELRDADFGLDPQRFGRHPDGSAAPGGHLLVPAPSLVEIKLPVELAVGAEFAVTGTLHEAEGQGSVQLRVTISPPAEADALHPGTPLIVSPGGPAEARVEQALADFRSLFPAAMCHARIVPVDEVVTLILFHREDQHLVRLMLDDAERARLDRLWDELHYASQDALRIENALEQILEFATQDADPRKFDPVLEPIAKQAAAFRRRLVETEPVHVEALLRFAARAYRRELRESERRGLRELYRALRGQELPHAEAFRLTLARVFASPAFLYRLETPGPSPARAPISNDELASRLSYFLWSSLPDDELREVVAAGRLTDDAQLVAQTRRMLADPRTRRLAVEFACQWLHLRDFDQLDEKSPRHFPEFAELRDDFYEESVRFFEDLFRSDGSILNIIDADYTFANEELARHYGLAGVTGPQWRRVSDVRQLGRGGVLGQAATLARQSGASRTSPVLRGNWIFETLLGERLPKPPPDVPQLPDDEAALAGLTVRQLVEKHTAEPACAKCHRRFDPYGLALESYDAIGRLRDKDLGGRPIDTRATLPDGTEIDGFDGLRQYLLTTRRDDFVRQFCRKLLGYALGRAVQLSDEPLLDEMTTRLRENDYRFSVAVETIVLSSQFRMIRGEATASR